MNTDEDYSNMSNTTPPDDPYAEINTNVDQYATLIIFFIGFPGNIICFIIWIQKRMRNSSGVYLAALAMADLIFLLLLVVYELQMAWGVTTLHYPIICSTFPIVHIVAQHLSPILVLAFTTERYISICHPFKREKFCTVRRAKIVIACLVIFTFSLSAVQGYFFKLNPKPSTVHNGTDFECGLRKVITYGGTRSIYQIYTTTVDLMCFLVGNSAVLVLNILVILEMRRLSRCEATQLHGGSQRTSATTVMLLCVSFYQIITTMPVSIAYALYMEYSDVKESDPNYAQAVGRYHVYNHILTIIREYGITHYAFNIFIYLITGKMFRQELKRLLTKPCGKLSSSFPSDYASLRNTTIRASTAATNNSTTNTTWVTVNGNQASEKKEPSANETLL